ncbi:MAG TPA: hypothetical protein VFC24_06215 [Casimicrobiaceae bacterium]|nr:hypothetical protein [Casimicrobiaceae bacterium]
MTRREFMALALGWLASAHASAHEAAHAHEPDAEEIALGSLADAELAFATTASRDGRRAAVFSHAARGAVLLDERIIGLRELANAPVESTRHQSQPAQIGVARGHDLGYASGAYRDDHAAGAPVHGVFLRLWQRQGSGPWRIVVSAGIRTPGPVDFIALGAAPRPSYAGKADLREARHAIAELEARIAGNARARASLAAPLAPDVRRYRPGVMPMTGRDALARMVAEAGRVALDAPALIEVARTADLALAYGTSRAPRRGWYVHVWLRSREGAWRLAYDMASAHARE